jgi:hypothetical protein
MPLFSPKSAISNTIAADGATPDRGKKPDAEGARSLESRGRTFPTLAMRCNEGAAIASPRVLSRPQPGFYVMRLRAGAPLVPAVIYRLCPMVIPQPATVSGPHPADWCRPLDRSPRYEARINGQRVDVDRVWTARSLRAVSLEEFRFRMGPLRRWARQALGAPEIHPEMRVDLNRLPPLF